MISVLFSVAIDSLSEVCHLKMPTIELRIIHDDR
jgi:hypothetical protein